MIKRQEIYPQIKFVTLLLLMASLPFAIKVSNAFILVSVLISSLPFFSDGNKRLTNKLTILILLFFLVEVLSLIYTRNENIKTGWSEIETHLPLLLVPFIFRDLEVLSGRSKYLKLAFVVGCLIGSTICLIANIQLSLFEGKVFHEYYFSHDRLSEPIGLQAVYFGLYLSVTILIIVSHLSETFSRNSYLKNVGLCILLVYFLLMIVASGARTAIVALMLIMVFNVIVYALITRKYKYLLIASFIPIIFIALVMFNPVVMTRFSDLRHSKAEGSNYDSYFARTNIWKPGLDVILTNGWIGVGIGDQQEELNASYMRHDYGTGVEFNFNMHNQYMQVMLGTGIVGLSIFLLILGLQLFVAIKSHNFLYLSFIVLFSLTFLTESTLSRSKGIILFTLFSFFFYYSTVISSNQRSS